MTSELLSAPRGASASGAAVSGAETDELLNREVADFMTPGCVVISESASVADAAAVLERYRVHAVLVLGARNGTPLGWVTARGLLGWVGRNRTLAPARDAITEQVRAIGPHQAVRVALYAISLSGTTRLLVRRKPNVLPEGVVTEFDLGVAAKR